MTRVRYPDAEDADRRTALALTPVSRETSERLATYLHLLRRWQKIKNLVASSTLDKAWTRHVADSLQLIDLAPTARHWADLGSGAGFPGLVIAIRFAEMGEGAVDLIESDHRKCAFLRTVIRETGARAEVHAGRIEEILPGLPRPIDVVTARGLAPLGQLVEHAKFLLTTGAIGIFPKGRGVDAELTEMRGLRSFRFDLFYSRTDPDGRIVVVRATKATPDHGDSRKAGAA